MSAISSHSPAGASSFASTSNSAASGAVAALNSPRIDDSSRRTDASESSVDVVQAAKPPEKKGWFWTQFMTRSGLFAPLAPEDSPEAVAERAMQDQERRRLEKLESVHRWRPSQDNLTSPQKQKITSAGHPTRPSMMKRLSSAVELNWWSGAPAEAEEAGEAEDLQTPKRNRGVSQSSMSRSYDIPEDDNNGDIQLR